MRIIVLEGYEQYGEYDLGSWPLRQEVWGLQREQKREEEIILFVVIDREE
jgi:hypothetical protein